MSHTRVRRELEDVLQELLRKSALTGEISLDAIGEAIGARAVSQDDISAIMDALEATGARITGPEGGSGEDNLKKVVLAARTLGAELGRRATTVEVAERAGLSLDEVRHALALARIMQR